MTEDSVPLATGNPENMDEQLETGPDSSETTSALAALDGTELINLGVQLQDEYVATGDPLHLDQAVEANREAMKVIPKDQVHWKILVYNFGLVLIDKYNHTKNVEHLEEAIEITEQTFYEMRSHDVEHFSILLNLTTMHNLKYAHTGSMDDLDRVIQLRQFVVDLAPEGAPEMPTYLINLAVCHKDKARSIDSLKCMDEGLERLREAFKLAPESHPHRLLSLRYIGILLFHRYKLTGGSISDLEESIKVGREVVESMHQDDADKANALEYLSDRLWTRYLESEKEMVGREGPQSAKVEAFEGSTASRPNDNLPISPEAQSPELDTSTNPQKYVEESALMLKRALKIENKHDAVWATRQNKLCRRLYTKYLHTEALSDLLESIKAAKGAIEATKDPSERSAILLQTGKFMMATFRKFGRDSDIEEAIRLAKEAAETVPREHKDWPKYQSLAGLWMGYQYSKNGNMDTLNEGIRLARDAASNLPAEHRHKAFCAMNLANLLDKRFVKTWKLADCEESIKATQEAIASTPLGHEDRPGQLMELGWQFGQKYVQSHAEPDLQNAIRITRDALENTPKSSPDLAQVLHNLGRFLGMQHLRDGQSSDLEEAISVLLEGLQVVATDHKVKPMLLTSLAKLLRHRHGITKDLEDLNKSIQFATEAVDLSSEDSKSIVDALFELGNSLRVRFKAKANIHDIDEAIRVQKDALARVWEEHPNRYAYLNNLALSLHQRYLTAGNLEDLNECIQLSQESVKATPESHEDYFDRMNNLGDFLRTRYARIGRLVDLDEAIRIGYKLKRESSADQRNRDIYLSNLSLRLYDRYARTNKDSNLDDAIKIAREAASLKNKEEGITLRNSINLGTWIFGRYRVHGRKSDYDEAHSIWKQVLENPALDESGRRSILQNLCSLLTHQYRITKRRINIETAIEYGREAVQLSSPTSPQLAGRRANLGDALGTKYLITKDSAALDEAISLFRQAMEDPNTTVQVRLLAGKELINYLALDFKFQDAFEVARAAIALIPQLISRSLNNADKQQLLVQVRDIASEAASAALGAGEEPSVALSLLEQGRGIIATSVQDSRADINELRRAHPDLADRFNAAKEKMDQSQALLLTETTPVLSQKWVDDNFDKVLIEIRQKAGFEDFLKTPTAAKMKEAANRGPVVVINVSRLQCDAILVEKHQIQRLPLQRLNFDRIMEMARGARRDPASQEILEWMWDDIVHPVLDKLGFSQCPADSNWPHIWWIPTGLLTHFPLHAAGYHLKSSSETALDRVMSSYSTSIKAMLHSRRQPTTQPSDDATAVLVAMDSTDGHYSLPFAPREIEEVAKICAEMGITAIKPPQRKSDVLSQLRNCAIFHFAGHGHTDPADPAMSYLVLKDGADNPFTVANLMDLDHERSPFLAYLSACGTGSIKDERLLDEGIHLIGACQMAGFRHAIGTLWEVKDDECVDMAKGIYETMRDGNMTDESVCLGIHSATRKARDRWLSAQEESREDGLNRHIVMLDEDKMSDASKWAPYVHFGV